MSTAAYNSTTVERHNAEQRQAALAELQRIMLLREGEGGSGSISIRIPIQRGRWGNVRVIDEREK